jgi:hypothetical protein
LKQVINTKWIIVFIRYAIACCYFSIGAIQAQEYIIGVEDISYYPLYDFSGQKPFKESFTKELFSTFFRHQGYQFKFVSLPLKRFDKWYTEDAIDFKFPDNVRWRSEQSKSLNIYYSQPVIELIAGSFVLKENKNSTGENMRSLGTVFGFFPTLWYERINANSVKLVEVTSPYSIIKHLLRGNIDVTNIDKNVINHNLKLLGKTSEDVVLNTELKSELYAYHFSSINHPKIINEFNAFLNENPEIVTAIKKKYSIIEAELIKQPNQ